jgi:hypothetical protein
VLPVVETATVPVVLDHAYPDELPDHEPPATDV